MLPKLFAITLALAPSLVSAALFPSDSLVKMIDPRGFKKLMKENSTSVVAFVAPWCGHCQKMAPEFSRAALGLYPLVPLYAMDCDKKSNKQLCAEQGVQGFPTVKLYPRGGDPRVKALTYDGPQRTASAFFYWASRNVPHGVKKLYHLEDIPGWIEQNVDKPRALLLNQGKGIPLLWQTLGNKYKDHLAFAIHRDRKGKSSVKMGLEQGEKKSSKVLLYPAGSTDFVRFEGIQKHDSLSKFFDSVIDGTVDLSSINAELKQEEFVPDERDLEIERKQEAQRMALAHGGMADLVDFEEAIKQGHGADFHETNGYPGMMGGGGLPKKDEKKEDPIKKILKAQQEAAAREASPKPMAKTGDAGQVVFEAAAETGHPKTPIAESTPSVAPVAEPSTSTITPHEDNHEESGHEGGDSGESYIVEPTPAEGEAAPMKKAGIVEKTQIDESTAHVKDEL